MRKLYWKQINVEQYLLKQGLMKSFWWKLYDESEAWMHKSEIALKLALICMRDLRALFMPYELRIINCMLV